MLRRAGSKKGKRASRRSARVSDVMDSVWKDEGSAEVLILSRLKIEEDAKIPNAATFTLKKQDHTLGNMIRS